MQSRREEEPIVIELNPRERRLYDRLRAVVIKPIAGSNSGFADLLLVLPDTVVLMTQRLQRLLVGGFAACGIAVLLLACEAAVIGNNAAPSDGADLALFRDVLRRVGGIFGRPGRA